MRTSFLFFLCWTLLGADPTADSPFGELENRARDSATVTVKAEALRVLSRIAAREDPELREFLQAMNGLTEIHVHSLKFAAAEEPTAEEWKAVRARIQPERWKPFLNVRSKGVQESVDAFMGPAGLAVLVKDDHEATFVELLGTIDPSQIGRFSGRFGLPQLEADEAGTKRDLPLGAAGRMPDAKLDFGHVVKRVESRYGVRKTWVPMWLVKPAALIGSRGQASGLNLAVFENPPAEMRSAEFLNTVGRALPEGWTQLVDVRGRDGRELVRIWLGGIDKKMRLLLATVDDGDAVVMTVRANLDEIGNGAFGWGATARGARNGDRE